MIKTTFFMAASLIVLAGCQGVDTSAHASTLKPEQAAPGPSTTLIVAREQVGNSLDIHGVGTNRPAYGTSWNVYDRLVTYGHKTLPDGQVMYDYQTIQPELAERWQVTDEHITFQLRKDATFHDGSPVTAEDVKWSFDRALAIGGFPTFQMKAGSLEKPEQFEVVDAHTFRVKLVRKDKLTLPDLGVPVAAVYNKKLALTHATTSDPWAQEWLKNNDAGSGAYRVEKFEPGVQEVLARFDDWKSGPLPRMQRVVVRSVPSAATRRALIERGDVDMSFDLPPRDFAELAKLAHVKVQGVPVENFMWYLDMNVEQKPFDDVRVRRAVAAAIPYREIYERTCFGRCLALYGAASSEPSTSEWPQPFPNRTDLDQARALLAEAGLAGGFSTKLYFDLGLATWTEPIALLVQQSLRKIGVQVTLEKVPGANWRGEMGKKSMPFLINDMGGWLNYPDYFFFWNYHGQNAVFNTMSYQDPVMDRHIDAARFASDPALYESSVKAFIARAMSETPRIPLYQANLDVAMKPSLQGYRYWFHRQLDFRQLHKEN